MLKIGPSTFLEDEEEDEDEVSIGSSFLNFPQAVEHLLEIARAHPPPAVLILAQNDDGPLKWAIHIHANF